MPKNSQLSHVSGDAFGQRVEVLVTAAHHGLQARTFARTLGSGHTARLLLAWEKQKQNRGDRGESDTREEE